MGLTEVREDNRNLIKRKPEGKRFAGALLEDAISQIDSLDKIERLPNPNTYGDTHEEQLFQIALELIITWINRILFLKLLEAQLLAYHQGDETYGFLNLKKIKNYDELNNLFFQVLARQPEDRNEIVCENGAFEGK